MSYRTLKLAQLIAEIEHSATNDDVDGLKIAQLVAEIEHTGGGGLPEGLLISQLIAEIEHGPTGDRPAGVHVAQLVAEIEYTETYPNRPLNQYSPRILVDLWTDEEIKRSSTVNITIEEIE